MRYYGDFYRLDGYRCRSTLEIVDSCVSFSDPNQLLCKQPDIVVVMMNPGASKPMEQGDGLHRCSHRIGVRANLVPTCPDKTQKSIEKVMQEKKFKHVRIINISDVREAKSDTFLKSLRHNYLPASHSIFCNKRASELENRLKSRTGMVIVAWGKDYRLRQLASIALSSFKNKGLGVHGWGDCPLFYHPARRAKKWPKWILCNWPY